MNVGQITMDRTEARRRWRAYRDAIHTRADTEYEQAITAYKALARGTPIVILSQAFALAPLDEKGRVRLAIARADEHQVELIPRAGAWVFEPPGWGREDVMRVRRTRARDTRAMDQAPRGYALVPMVPPEVRKDYNLARCWILWEVERWADQRIRATPDRDPLLLRYLGGEAYAVLGQWDLTEIERAIMAGRV